MFNDIPDQIMRRMFDPLDEDVRRIWPKSHQLYVYDILERIVGICDIQVIRIDTYTDGKFIIIENTREIVYKGSNIALMDKSEKGDPSNKTSMKDLLNLPVTIISPYTDYSAPTRGGYNLFVDSEYLDKLEVLHAKP